jgi:hypothetical protein
LIVSIGDVTARCRECSGTEFEPVVSGELRLTTVLACKRCSTTVTYRELIEQIGEEAMKRANEALDNLGKKRGLPRKPKK